VNALRLLLVSLLLCGCTERSLLVVELLSDLVPGEEVVRADLQVTSADGGPVHRAETALTGGSTGRAPIDGLRLAEIADLPVGAYRLHVDLIGPDGAVVLERDVAVRLSSGSLAVTVVMTRDCVGVTCDDTSPSASTCVAGRCASPECTPETPEFCEPECSASSCPAPPGGCAVAMCVEGACLSAPDDSCGDTHYCDPEVGCLPRTRRDAGVPDAGVLDAGRVDSGLADAGLPDSGLADSGPPAPMCPLGYVGVRGDSDLGSTDFCVMRFEARAWRDGDGDGVVQPAELQAEGCGVPCSPGWGDATHTPVADHRALPWRNISAHAASERCRSLGPGYDLISNLEAITIARAAESEPVNWMGLAVGVGGMVEGNTDGSAGYAGYVDPSDPYDSTGNGPGDEPGMGREQRRVFLLPDGASIYDFSGNVQEWTDADPTTPGFDTVPFSCPSGGYDFEEIDTVCPAMPRALFAPATGVYDRTDGVGAWIGGSAGALRRGGQSSDGPAGLAGAFAFNLNRGPDFTATGTGFRCVFRP